MTLRRRPSACSLPYYKVLQTSGLQRDLCPASVSWDHTWCVLDTLRSFRELREDLILEASFRVTFPSLTLTSPVSRAKRCRRLQKQKIMFLQVIPGSSDPSGPRRHLYQVLVEEAVLNSLCGRLVLSVTELRSFWIWEPITDYFGNNEFSLTLRFIRNSLSLNDIAFRRV